MLHHSIQYNYLRENNCCNLQFLIFCWMQPAVASITKIFKTFDHELRSFCILDQVCYVFTSFLFQWQCIPTFILFGWFSFPHVWLCANYLCSNLICSTLMCASILWNWCSNLSCIQIYHAFIFRAIWLHSLIFFRFAMHFSLGLTIEQHGCKVHGYLIRLYICWSVKTWTSD